MCKLCVISHCKNNILDNTKYNIPSFLLMYSMWTTFALFFISFHFSFLALILLDPTCFITQSHSCPDCWSYKRCECRSVHGPGVVQTFPRLTLGCVQSVGRLCPHSPQLPCEPWKSHDMVMLSQQPVDSAVHYSLFQVWRFYEIVGVLQIIDTFFIIFDASAAQLLSNYQDLCMTKNPNSNNQPASQNG